MKNLPQRVIGALSAGSIAPVWLMKLELASESAAETLYLSDQPVSLWGQSWSPIVTSWGAIDSYFDPQSGDWAVSDVTVMLSNLPGLVVSGSHGISWYFRKYDLARSTATIYLWLANSGLVEPSGANLNDLLVILSGKPELAKRVSPSECPLDIVSRQPSNSVGYSYGDLLRGVYTRNQWESLPPRLEGGWKPLVFGASVHCDGIPLSEPFRGGKVTGPASLFDPSQGANQLMVTFPKSGFVNSSSPFPAPCEIYLGDWRLPVFSAPAHAGQDTWIYTIGRNGSKYCVPAEMLGTEPLFVPSATAPWPARQDFPSGPRASAEPAIGSPYQFFHGPADTGNYRDGMRPGLSGCSIQSVYVNGSEIDPSLVVKDDPFGIAWIRLEGSPVRGKPGNPHTLRVKFTAVDNTFNTGGQYMNASQLTASFPYGYNIDASPVILGDFAVPASGGGAPVSTQLGLVNTPAHAAPGARVASVRFVMRYTAPEISNGTFNATLFGSTYSFPASALVNNAAALPAGWWVVKERKGTKAEIWPNNNWYPITAISPVARNWEACELSRDVTTEALSSISSLSSIGGSFRAWFTGSSWPASLNSVIVLSCELEILYEGVASAADRPRVTAIVNSGASTAGQILQKIIPPQEIGNGFSDPALPQLNIRAEKQQSVSAFIKSVCLQSGLELSRSITTGKLDLMIKKDTHDNINTPPPSGGASDITESSMLADSTGAAMITRMRSAPDCVINEVTVSFTNQIGGKESVTLRNESSIAAYGTRKYFTELAAATTRAGAENHALDILNANSDVNDYYRMTFPIGPAALIEPNDILRVTSSLDNLNLTKMRAVSVEIDPGSLMEGRMATVTINAQRFSKARMGFGQTTFGQAVFGSGQIMEN